MNSPGGDPAEILRAAGLGAETVRTQRTRDTVARAGAEAGAGETATATGADETGAARKVAALHDHGLPQDVVDVHALAGTFTGRDLEHLGARELGPDFSRAQLRDQLDHVAVYGEEAFAACGVGLEEIMAITRWAQGWADAIGQDLAEEEPWTDEEP